MKKEKSKGSKRLIVAAGLALICMLVPFCLGVVFQPQLSWGRAGYGISAILLLLLVAGSLVGDVLFRRWQEHTKVKTFHEQFERRRERMRNNEEREKRRLEAACALAVVYVILLALAALGVCFFSGAISRGVRTTMLFSVYLLFGLIFRLLRQMPEPDHTGTLPEKEFPRLYALAREAMGIDEKVPLLIFLGAPVPEEECNASVAQRREEIHLLLGPMLLCVVTEKELAQIIRHEFAHVEMNHTRELIRFNRVIEYLAGEQQDSFTAWVTRVLRFPTCCLALEGEYYFLLSSAAKERRADDQAADAGDRIAQACALAKTRAHGLFTYEQEPYTNFFRTETMPEDFAEGRIRLFRQQLTQREQVWRSIMEREIQSRSATHPTFRQRWDALGNCPYSLKPAPEDGEFARECWAAAAEAGRRLREALRESYDQLREENYLSQLRIIQSYEAEHPAFTPEEMRPVILAYYRLGQPQQAEQLCDQLMAEHDSPFATAFARYWKGVLLLSRYDKAGLALLYQAMETNRNYIESGLEHIGSFCTMMGLEQELEDYRSRAADFLQTKRDFSGGGIHAKAGLLPETLPEGWQEQILAYILKQGAGNIRQVYLVHEQVNESYAPSSFVLRYTDGLSREECSRIYGCVFRLLDDWPTDWEFCLYEYEPAMEKVLAKVPGACIYDAR